MIDSAQQLALDQIDELVRTGNLQEALSMISRMMDLPPALVRIEPAQFASTQRVQVYRSLEEWSRIRRRSILAADRDLQESFDHQWNDSAELAFKSLQISKSPIEGAPSVSRYDGTSSGVRLSHLLVDILLEREKGLVAARVLDDSFPFLTRIDIAQLSSNSPSVKSPRFRVLPAVQSSPLLSESFFQQWKELTQANQKLVVDVITRQLIAAAIQPELLDLVALQDWAETVAEAMENRDEARRLMESVAMVREWDRMKSVTASHHFALDQWPKWQVQLERYSNSFDLTPASQPPVGQLQSYLPSIPEVYENKVFIHELTQIRAFDVKQGTSWPSVQGDRSLYDSQIAPAAVLPLGYPMIGDPKGHLTIANGCLYARMGSPVTAWANRIRASDGSSISYLVGLDLDQQGRLLRGFPLRLQAPEFKDEEFEGCPIVDGSLLIAVVTQRDQGSIRRSLAAFDRFSGRLIWRSQVLGRGIVVGSQRANLISHTQPVAAGGFIYYASDLGTVTCLNAQTGQIVWLANYLRSGSMPADYPRPNRFRYRNGNPCQVHQGLVYCLPQDCPELFALDALTGDLVWSTDDIDVVDCTHLVGIEGRTLLVNGDRLVWVDCRDGKLLSRFPAGTTPGVVNSLPQPRGLGKAAVSGGRVYWPTSGEVYVFQADLYLNDDHGSPPVDSPPLLHRFATQARGAEGGNLVAFDQWMLMTTPGRLMCLQSE